VIVQRQCRRQGSADAGGPIAGLKAFFSGLPPESYATAMEKSGVTPMALGSGYLTFYLYSTAIGVFAVVLAFMVARRQPAVETPDAPA
jgi:PAT family beta-lactamase induction signal transducer AmpG